MTWSRSRILVLLIAALALGCGRTREMGVLSPAKEAPAPRSEPRAADRGAPADMAKMSEEAPAELQPQPLPASGGEAAQAASAPAPERRKRIYSGSCSLVVDDVELTKRQLGSFAEANGGYVESASGDTIVLRVPAERFRELFDQVLGFGEVTRSALETQDVSDTFRDLEARLAISQSARERLYRLLERATDVEERLAILREIKRLSEEVERIRLQLDSLERQIAFSRIAVELESRLSAEQLGRQSIPFPWIAELNPLYETLAARRSLPWRWRALPEALGEGFAVVEKRRGLLAESPEGTRLRLGRTRNQPRGDDSFWQKALAYHLGRFYKTVEPVELGPLRGVLLTSKDRDPFVYLVTVCVTGRDLRVLEVFFPTQAALAERLPAVRTALEALEASQ